MKKLFALLMLLGFIKVTTAQTTAWNVNGTHIYNPNTGSVGIGTVTPTEKLHIIGTLQVDYPGTGNGGVRIFKNGSDAITSHLYIGNSGNNRAFNFQLNNAGSAMTLWSYNGTSWSNKMSFINDGKVGIGTSSPVAKLQVSDGTDASLNVYSESYNIAKISAMNAWNSYVFGIDGTSGVGHIWNHFTNLTPILNFSINATNSTPQVWIGTPDPTHSFAEFQVKGTIACKQLFVVSNTAWPDYVFKRDYELMPLNKVEEFYTKENHLPGIPSAEEIKEKDIDVGEMNALLLKKIEELTIYVVEQDKKIEALKHKLKNK